jgi:hypothetical protein
MKKIFILLLFVLLRLFVYSQARLGWTETQIRNDFSTVYFTTAYTDDGTKYIYGMYNGSNLAYFFDENGLCDFVVLYPEDQGALNYFVELYNRKYVIISDTKWKAYLTNGGVVNIELKNDDFGTFFIFY